MPSYTITLDDRTDELLHSSWEHDREIYKTFEEFLTQVLYHEAGQWEEFLTLTIAPEAEE